MNGHATPNQEPGDDAARRYEALQAYIDVLRLLAVGAAVAALVAR
jgi:hypothetical protein